MMKGHKLKTKALALFQSPVADIVVRAGSEPIRILGVCANRGTFEYSDQERHSWRWVGTSDDRRGRNFAGVGGYNEHGSSLTYISATDRLVDGNEWGST